MLLVWHRSTTLVSHEYRLSTHACALPVSSHLLYEFYILIPCDSCSTNCTASQTFMPLVTNVCRRDNLQFQVIVPKGVHLLQNAHHVSDSCTELQYKPACRECLNVPSP
jgi:hypothetical protein